MIKDQPSSIQDNEIVKVILSSVTSLEIMSLFNRNPNLIDTIQGVAKRLGVGAEKVQADLEQLVNAGLLKKRTASNSPVYLLDKMKAKEVDSQIQAAISRVKTVDAETKDGGE